MLYQEFLGVRLVPVDANGDGKANDAIILTCNSRKEAKLILNYGGESRVAHHGSYNTIFFIEDSVDGWRDEFFYKDKGEYTFYDRSHRAFKCGQKVRFQGQSYKIEAFQLTRYKVENQSTNDTDFIIRRQAVLDNDEYVDLDLLGTPEAD
jgi:hypothetical protein